LTSPLLAKRADTILALADSFFASRDYPKALLLYHEAQTAAFKMKNDEDLYHSFYRLSQCHVALNNTKAAIHYAQRAFDIHPRAEPMFYVAQFLEGRDEDGLSSDDFYYAACHATYDDYLSGSSEPAMLDALRVIDKGRLWPRRFPQEYLAKLASFQAILDDEDASIETHEQTHWEMIGSTRAILGCAQELFRREGTFHNDGDFYYATPSLIRHQGRKTNSSDSSDSSLQAEGVSHAEYLILVRLINYRIDHEGRWYKDFLPAGQNSGTLRSAAALFLNATDQGSILRVLDDRYEKSPTRFLGTEDPKLLSMNDGTVRIIWTSWEYAKAAGEGSRLVMGILDTDSKTIQLDHVFPSPFDHYYEKNWVAFQRPGCDALYLIYEWHPLRMGVLDTKSGTIQFNMTRSTPRSFHHLRGSSNGVVYKNDVWLMVHGTTWHEGPGPTYYHRVIVLDSATFEVKRFTYPFKLESTEAPVEFSLGLDIDRFGEVTIAYSVFDGSTVLRRIPIWKLEALMVTSHEEHL
jgi:tetratricopeptide (TPR) repeat protein